jgi:hypothetical protein
MELTLGICLFFLLLKNIRVSHAARMRDIGNAYKFVVGNSDGKRPLRRPRLIG